MIEIRGVSKRYGNTTVVDDVSLTLPRGGVTSIIGPNGAGKSTLLSIVSRLIRADAGTILVDGLDVENTPNDVLARRLSILRQENHFAPRLTVEDLVAFGRYPYSKGRPTARDREHVEAALDHLELSDLRHRFLDELSGGQRQRAFVAMVLCQDTDYVLLDEPLAGLDLRHAASMMRRLSRIASDLHKSIVLVVHDVNFASSHSDRIVAMKDGRVIHEGTPWEVMRPDVLHAVYDMDVRVEEIGGAPIGIYFA